MPTNDTATIQFTIDAGVYDQFLDAIYPSIRNRMFAVAMLHFARTTLRRGEGLIDDRLGAAAQVTHTSTVRVPRQLAEFYQRWPARTRSAAIASALRHWCILTHRAGDDVAFAYESEELRSRLHRWEAAGCPPIVGDDEAPDVVARFVDGRLVSA